MRFSDFRKKKMEKEKIARNDSESIEEKPKILDNNEIIKSKKQEQKTIKLLLVTKTNYWTLPSLFRRHDMDLEISNSFSDAKFQNYDIIMVDINQFACGNAVFDFLEELDKKFENLFAGPDKDMPKIVYLRSLLSPSNEEIKCMNLKFKPALIAKPWFGDEEIENIKKVLEVP
ncbi:MAG: hypothetical protein ACPLZ9_04485 [Candidatus Ratteibacteria bacterium]